MALALAEMVDNGRPERLFASELSRLREKSAPIASEPAKEVVGLIRSWLASRAHAVRVEAAPADIESIRDDARLVPSGLSDPRTDLAAATVAEGYIARADVDTFADDHFLTWMSGTSAPTSSLHVIDAPTRPVPRLLSAADVIDHGGPREVQEALRLLGRT